MRAIKCGGLVVMLLAVSAFGAASQVTWNARAYAFDYNGADVDLSVPFNPANPAFGGGVLIQWTVSCEVTGDNQGLGGAMVAMGVKDIGTNAWAPVTQADDTASLFFPASFKAPGTGANGGIDAVAGQGGPGMGKGANRGYPAAGFWYVGQMGAGYLDWAARRYKTTAPKAWVGDQQWGVGLASRKTVLLKDGVDGQYDLVSGIIDITSLPIGKYSSEFDKGTAAQPNIGGKTINLGTDLNVDQPAVPMTEIAFDNILLGSAFTFEIVPEPATMLLLAGAGLFIRRRRA